MRTGMPALVPLLGATFMLLIQWAGSRGARNVRRLTNVTEPFRRNFGGAEDLPRRSAGTKPSSEAAKGRKRRGRWNHGQGLD